MVKGQASKAARRKARKRAGKIGARRKREFTYRGYTLEELQSMTLNELLPLLPARARRSYQRGLNKEQQRFIERLKSDKKEILRTHRREIFVLPEFVGKKVAVYTGKEYKIVEIIPEMIGHCLGEFATTRRFEKHSGPGVGATRSSKYMPLK
ncbi:MAG: 30S ribosomal protein S19 [Methanomassiliicoccales archaeon]|nr:MAG: 30S ribosomal protein S19 [Methanomassiliicoccales archaeon]